MDSLNCVPGGLRGTAEGDWVTLAVQSWTIMVHVCTHACMHMLVCVHLHVCVCVHVCV